MIFILIYFIFGMLFFQVIIPLLEGIMSLVLMCIEALKSKISIYIAKNNKTILAIDENTSIHPIGSAVSKGEDVNNDL